MFKRKQGYSMRDAQSAVRLVIDGQKYVGHVDTPEFIAFMEANRDVKGGEPEEDIAYVAGFMAALVGADQARRMFDGVPRSYAQYMGLMGYVLEQVTEQGVAGRIREIGAKYSRANLL